MKKWIGYGMIAAPFAAIFAFAASEGSFLQAVALFAGVAALMVWLAVGVKLAA